MGHCSLSNNQLYIHSSGEVYTCSFLQNKPEHVLGHIGKESLQEIWNSRSRLDFLESHNKGNPGHYCQKHQQDFLCHKISNQRYFNEDGNLKRLDIMLDSACNLKCIMCTNIYDRTGGLKSEFFWLNNKEVFSSIQEIELVGGEPLISPYFPRLVNLVHDLNPQCRWFATTNAHFDLKGEIVSSLLKANFESLSISIDSLKKSVFEKIRVRSTFEKVYENVFAIKRLISNIQINTVVQLDNFEELIPIYRWTQEHDLRFYPILLQYPDTYSLKHLDDRIKKKWIMGVMEENEDLKSKDIFFFIKKFLAVDSVRTDPEIKMSYLRQLEILGKLYG